MRREPSLIPSNDWEGGGGATGQTRARPGVTSGCKLSALPLQPFFVERAFRIFDRDGNGTVSMAEFIDTMHQFAGQTSDEKLVFLFKVYDLDGQ